MGCRSRTSEARQCSSSRERSSPNRRRVRGLARRGHGSTTADARTSCTCPKRTMRFPASLNGRFHGLLADRTRGTATLFNDRYGMHRVYYHQAKDAFYFAAEAKAILAVRPNAAGLDPARLGEFVACGCVLEDRTLFDDVHVLPAGSALGIPRRASSSEKGAYFQPARVGGAGSPGAGRYYAASFGTSSRKTCRGISKRGQHVGMSLTGGTGHPDDHGLAQGRRRDRCRATRSAGMFRDCQDVVVARQVAQGLRAAARSRSRVGDEFLRRFSRIRRADGVPYGRMRRREPRARPLRQREGARDRPGQDDRKLRRGSPPPRPRLQADATCTRVVRSRVARRRSPGGRHVRGRSLRDTRCRLPSSARRRGITTACSRWSRPSSRCVRRTSTTTSSAPSSARRRRPSRATTCACG